LGFVVVTHAFHPLRGERLEVLFVKRRGAGVDGCCIEDFEKELTNNLYKVWNRMSAES